MKIPIFIQMQYGESGATSLMMVLGAYKKFLPIAEIRKQCISSRNGSSPKQILNAANYYGLEGFTKKINFNDLISFLNDNNSTDNNYAVIAKYRRNNYVVIKKIKNNKISFNDPTYGPTTVKFAKFKSLFTNEIICLKPGSNFTSGGKRASIYDMLKDRIDKNKKALIKLIVLIVLAVPVNILYINYSKNMIDDVLSQNRPEWFISLLCCMVSLFILSTLISILQTLSSYKISYQMANYSNYKLFNKIMYLPSRFFNQHYNGEILSRINNNQSLNNQLVRTIIPKFVSGALSSCYFLLMVYYNYKIAIICIAIEVLYIICNLFLQKFLAIVSRSVTTSSGIMDSFVLQGLNNIDTIKSTSSERTFFQHWAESQEKSIRNRFKYQNIRSLASILQTFRSTLTSIIILGFGAYLIINGEFTMGMLFVFKSVFLKVAYAIGDMLSVTNTIQTMRTNVERVNDVEKTEYKTTVKNDSCRIGDTHLNGNIRIKNLHFKYNEADAYALEKINLDINKGETVAIVGDSGSGKTTLMYCLSNFIEPTKGQITYGINANNNFYERSKIPDKVFFNDISTVNQEIVMFEDTIKNNLTLWNNKISDEEIIKSLDLAEIYARVDIEDQSINADIVENGRNFSMGELQRLELARALAQKPNILLLDEFTSSLDAITEHRIFDNIKKLGLTCIIAAHRFSTVAECDKIVVLEKGKVIQMGTHKQLSTIDGKYKQLLEMV